MTVMDLEPEQAIRVLRRRRQWMTVGALLGLIAILLALMAASAAMYSAELDSARSATTR